MVVAAVAFVNSFEDVFRCDALYLEAIKIHNVFCYCNVP